MTTARIDELTAATSITGDDLLVVMDGAALAAIEAGAL